MALIKVWTLVAVAALAGSLVVVDGLSPPPASAQFRSQSRTTTGAIQNQVRQAIRPRLIVRNPAGQVLSLAMSADGKVLAIALQDNSLRFWNLQSGQEQAIYKSPEKIRQAELSGNGAVAILTTESGKVVLVDAAAGSVLRDLPGSAVSVAGVARDGATIGTAGKDRVVRLFETGTGREVSTFRGHAADPGAIAVAADGSRVASGDASGKVFLWDRQSGQVQRQITLPGGAVVALGLGTGDRVVATTADGAIHLVDRGATQPTRSVRAGAGVTSAQVSPDGKAVAFSSGESRVGVIDVESGRVVREIAGPSGGSRFVLVDFATRRLMTGGTDGAVRVWNVADGANLAQIISTLNGWAVVDGQGRFDGSQQGVDDVAWAANQTTLPVDNFSQTHFEPGLLAKTMVDGPTYATPAAPSIEQGILLPPRVSIALPPGTPAAGAEIDVQVTAEDQGGGIAALRLFHNGKLLPQAALRDERTERRNNVDTTIRSYRVRLVAGANRLDAVGANQQSTDGEFARAVVQASGTATAPTLHLVTIGINKYKDSRFDLDYGVPDALSILQRLSAQTGKDYKQVSGYQLLDAAATRARIEELFKTLSAAPPNDVLVVYIASHGEMVGPEWYMLPHDAGFDSDEAVARTGIAATQLRDMLARVGPQRIFVMIDSCKSGGSIDILASALDRRALRSLGRETGIALLAAARRDQLAAELPKFGHGAFTYILLQGLAGKADVQPSDGRITASELIGYLTTGLPAFTQSVANHSQIPVGYARGEDFVLSLKGAAN